MKESLIRNYLEVQRNPWEPAIVMFEGPIKRPTLVEPEGNDEDRGLWLWGEAIYETWKRAQGLVRTPDEEEVVDITVDSHTEWKP